MAFIDYEKPFDSVQTSVVMEALRRQKIEEIYIYKNVIRLKSVQRGIERIIFGIT